jgi:hypothetical protein
LDKNEGVGVVDVDVDEGEERPLKDDERFNRVDRNPRLGSRCGDFRENEHQIGPY